MFTVHVSNRVFVVFHKLDGVYPNSNTRRVLAIFPNPKWKKPELKKTRKLKLDQIHFRSIENFSKKDVFWPNFGQNVFSNL